MFKLNSVVSGLLPGFGFSQPWPGGMNAKRSGNELPERREQNSRHHLDNGPALVCQK
jgi:hypothetical protein